MSNAFDEVRAAVDQAKFQLAAASLPRHKFWGAGEPDCPPELKAPNGELHTMRCKVCGDGWRKSRDVCFGALQPAGAARWDEPDWKALVAVMSSMHLFSDDSRDPRINVARFAWEAGRKAPTAQPMDFTGTATPRYGVDANNPRIAIRIHPDGRKERGRFADNGVFVPDPLPQGFERDLADRLRALDLPADKQRPVVDLAFWAMGQVSPVVVSAQPATSSVSVDTLRQHWLRAIECDHATGRDKPHCACSLVDLGWHPSVGAAVEAWLAHVSGSEAAPAPADLLADLRAYWPELRQLLETCAQDWRLQGSWSEWDESVRKRSEGFGARLEGRQ